MRTTFHILALSCLLAQGFPQSARAALGGGLDSVEADRMSMKGLTLPMAATQQRVLQLPSGTVVTEFLTPNGAVYAVSWHGPALPNLRQILGNYFARYQTAARTPVVRHRLVRLTGAGRCH